MKLLLDTHAFLWLNNDIEQLSEAVKTLCNAGTHEFYLSMASAWEMQIKNQLGKLTLTTNVEELVNKNRQENNIQLIPIELAHISYLKQLPQYHKDPFDRMIIAQAVIGSLTILSVDQVFTSYDVTVLW